MTSSTNQFPQLDVKLSGSNYREWSVSVKLLLDALDLTDHINDTSPPTEEKKLKSGIMLTDQSSHAQSYAEFQEITSAHQEFEALRGQLLHRSPLPTIDAALAELIAEETRLRVLHSSSSSTPTVLAAPNQVPPVPVVSSSEPLSSTNLFVPRKNKRNIQCKYCQLWGHSIQDCRKKKWADQHRHSPRGYPAAASTLQIEHPSSNNAGHHTASTQLSWPQLMQLLQQSNLNNSTPKEPESSPQTSSAPSGFGSLSTPSFGECRDKSSALASNRRKTDSVRRERQHSAKESAKQQIFLLVVPVQDYAVYRYNQPGECLLYRYKGILYRYRATRTVSAALGLAPVPVQEPVYRYKGVGVGGSPVGISSPTSRREPFERACCRSFARRPGEGAFFTVLDVALRFDAVESHRFRLLRLPQTRIEARASRVRALPDRQS
uniref:Retrotransposon Copia-like N-terminal domain-containing protein n=1 Tax=Ananas comosus var. bracteatus TaxID=296719 RepID=A0A6V7P285_ANACO|nr:unnamed protein product [Ananas comosus var. bracteatus]